MKDMFPKYLDTKSIQFLLKYAKLDLELEKITNHSTYFQKKMAQNDFDLSKDSIEQEEENRSLQKMKKEKKKLRNKYINT